MKVWGGGEGRGNDRGGVGMAVVVSNQASNRAQEVETEEDERIKREEANRVEEMRERQ